eukprot:515494_1
MALATCNNCDTPETDEKSKLYTCQYANCKKKNIPFCDVCGEASHKNKNKFKHDFNTDFIHVKEYKTVMNIQSKKSDAIIAHQTETTNINYAIKRTCNYSISAMYAMYRVGSDALIKEGVKKYGIKEIVKKAMSLPGYATKQALIKDAVKDGAKATGFVLEKAAKNAAIIQVAFCVFEIGCHIKRYNDSDGAITKAELQRLCLRSTTANAVSFGIGVGGAAVGFALGGPIGATIGGVACGVVADMSSRFLFDKFILDNDDQKEQIKQINEALERFRFINTTADNVFDDPRFNEETIDKEYHAWALNTHPDRKYGNVQEFEKVVGWYNVLRGVLKAKKKKKYKKDKNK